MKIDLSGKTVLITGASRGIGKAIARAMAAAGANVALHYNTNETAAEVLAKEIGTQAKTFQANLKENHAIVELYEEVLAAFGRVDVLVNNAGVAFNASIEMDDWDWMSLWYDTQQINLAATALLSKKMIPHFIENGGGIFIHISSRAAFRGDTADYLAYAASKGGMVALSRSIARAYGKQGIKSFVVAPGFTRTDMAQDFIDSYGEDYVKNDLALDELTEPKHIAPTVVFLASGLADHATGATIDINAGSYVH